MTRTIFLALITLIGVQITMASPTYRSVSFRDSVLNPIMFKAGLDPAKDLFSSDARALVSYINSWVRKLANEVDFPEWTTIEARTPDVNNVVALTTTPGESQIDRLLRAYLLDPRTTDGPLDIPFRRLLGGIWVGHEHGSQVWLKFMLPVPQFTSRIWNPTDTFSAGDLVYSVRAGECFRSRVNGNRGHDPGNFGPDPTSPFSRTPLPPTVTQPLVPDNLGIVAVNKKITIGLTGVKPPPDPPDPLPFGTSRVFIPIYDSTGTVLDSALRTGSGTPSLATVLTDLRNTFISSGILGSLGFVITVDTTALTITFEAPVEFLTEFGGGTPAYFELTGTAPIQKLSVVQISPYVTSVSPAYGIRQEVTVTIASDDVVAGSTYTLAFADKDGGQHVAQYIALDTDSTLQILSGLISAIQTARAGDTFFNDVSSRLDQVAGALVLSTGTVVGVQFAISAQASPYWDTVPFPMVMADQTVRGAYADWLKSEGQHAKGMAEEQLVTQEQGNRTGQEMAPHPNQLTDQIGVER